MSRHRNIRNRNFDDEYAGYDDIYGHSVEDDSYGISPSTADEFLYHRSHQDHSLSSFMTSHNSIQEDDEDNSDNENPLSDSKDYQKPKLNSVDEAKLQSCLEEIRNIVGDTIPEHVLIDVIIQYNFNFERSLDAILNQTESPRGAAPPRAAANFAAPFTKRKTAGTTTHDSVSTKHADKPSDVSRISSDEDQASQGATRLSFPARSEPMFRIGGDEPSHTRESDKLPDNATSTSVTLTSGTEGGTTSIPHSSSSTNLPRISSKARLPTIDVMAEYEKRQSNGKDLLNLVVIGHVDAGKSTLMGHLLYLLGNVNKKTMHKYEQESKKAGKASFAYAWVLDETGEERERGITMDVGLTNFETPQKLVTLLDAPGHKDFIPNMITGAAQADVATLVVDASRGEFEAGFDAGGQTREHALLVRSLGVTQLVIAVNKLDNVDWSHARYEEIVSKLGHFLKQAGFKDSEVSYIPCSGLTGENLVLPPKESKLKSWYNGCTLVQQIDKLKPPKRPLDKPFRLCVSDIFKGMGSGFSVTGKIVSGNVQSGDKILVMPAAEQGYVKTVFIHDEDTKWACAGDQAVLTVTGIDQMKVNVGSVLCSPVEHIRSTNRVQARVIIFNIEVPITRGYPVVFHYQTLSEPATVKKLVSLLHKSTGEIIKKKPR
ncbi:HBS1-like protein [Saccoglossus kowalevskii]|uniref:HBS1-like protein n=1 Tax=Saccoglossus kowalevskii TaxID=10224 RepID=A0ABM0GK45_SACKO|nr:PREDICTED: HBS1-like protein [Saccoglossus kowalevskii]